MYFYISAISHLENSYFSIGQLNLERSKLKALADNKLDLSHVIGLS